MRSQWEMIDLVFFVEGQKVLSYIKNIKNNKPLLKINPCSQEVLDSDGTLPVFRNAFSENIVTRWRAYLEILCPGMKSVRVEMDRGETILGRGSECRVQLKLPGVSKLHSRVTYRDEEYTVEDLGSTNGTYVNGVRVQRCVLRNNDQIQIDNANILFIEEKIRKDI